MALPQVRAPQVTDGLCEVQPQLYGVPPPPQLCGARHVPQSTDFPQLFVALSQLFPAQVTEVLSGVQPQVNGAPPPPHVCGAVHVPQLTVCPQLLVAGPQLFPAHVPPSSGGHGMHAPVLPSQV